MFENSVFFGNYIIIQNCVINPSKILRKQIELLDWKPEDLSPRSNGGILRHVVKKPLTRKTPNDGASVTGKFMNNLDTKSTNNSASEKQIK